MRVMCIFTGKIRIICDGIQIYPLNTQFKSRVSEESGLPTFLFQSIQVADVEGRMIRMRHFLQKVIQFSRDLQKQESIQIILVRVVFLLKRLCFSFILLFGKRFQLSQEIFRLWAHVSHGQIELNIIFISAIEVHRRHGVHHHKASPYYGIYGFILLPYKFPIYNAAVIVVFVVAIAADAAA